MVGGYLVSLRNYSNWNSNVYYYQKFQLKKCPSKLKIKLLEFNKK